ncbi:MAG: hypothetical protein ACXVAL_02745 [Vulcanimicrobiaceae bacterium]
MRTLNSDLSEQYHECVPLGWDPVPVETRYYYEGYTSEYWEEGVWLHPYWLGLIHTSDLSDPNVRAAYYVLNALTRAGMLERTSATGASFYRLTPRAIAYYFESNGFGNNPEHWSYLCYSRIVPRRVVWTKGVKDSLFRVAFEWSVSARAQWANDPFLRRHSVLLPPLSSPAVAVFAKSGDWWHITQLVTPTAMLPRTVDPAVWPSAVNSGVVHPKTH